MSCGLSRLQFFKVNRIGSKEMIYRITGREPQEYADRLREACDGYALHARMSTRLDCVIFESPLVTFDKAEIAGYLREYKGVEIEKARCFRGSHPFVRSLLERKKCDASEVISYIVTALDVTIVCTGLTIEGLQSELQGYCRDMWYPYHFAAPPVGIDEVPEILEIQVL